MVECLTDELAARYAVFVRAQARAELERFFVLDDVDRELVEATMSIPEAQTQSVPEVRAPPVACSAGVSGSQASDGNRPGAHGLKAADGFVEGTGRRRAATGA
ncbi:hypothetical protein AB0L06_30715 [Spirillospora sp. NPDC052269]